MGGPFGPPRSPLRHASSTFLAPTLPGTLVERSRLFGRLGFERGAAWSLVVGPPGAGKTTLVRSWMAARGGPWAWISVTVVRYRSFGLAEEIVRAVQWARPERLLDTIDDIGDAEVDDIDMIHHLVDELSLIQTSPIILVLDDAHLLDGHEWALLQRFVAQLPPALHLVVIGRSEPPLPLAREILTGRLARVGPGELAFDRDETAQLLGLVAGLSVESSARQLHDAMEGWAAGIRLAALAIREGTAADNLLDRLDRRDSTIAEFLVEEVLDLLPADRRLDLGRMALMEVLEPDLCDAITGRTDSKEILDRLAADGLFVSAVDGDTDRYRFHHLLGALLRSEFERDEPEEARDAHLTAADWLQAGGRSIESIEHLLAVGELDRAHQLVIEHFRPLYVGSHRNDLDRWLMAIPDEIVTETPERAVEHCAALALIAHERAAWWHRYCVANVPPDDRLLSSRIDAIEALNHIVNGRIERAHASWRRSRERRPDDHTEPIDEVLHSWDIRLGALFGDPNSAVAAAHRLQDMGRQLVGDAPVLSVLAGALEHAGEHEQAHAVAERSIETWRSMGEPDLPGMVDALVVVAAVARRAGDLDLADELLDTAFSVVPDWAPGPHALSMIPLVERARVARDRGDASWRARLVGLVELMRVRGRSPQVVDWVMRAVDELDRAAQPTYVARASRCDVGVIETLTDRELTILDLLASHLSLPEIGTELFISRHTVKSHVTNIYRKLGASSRSEAVRVARELGLLA